MLIISPTLSRIDWTPDHLHHKNWNQFLGDCKGVALWITQTCGFTLDTP